jgi:hypothetical protein
VGLLDVEFVILRKMGNFKEKWGILEKNGEFLKKIRNF